MEKTKYFINQPIPTKIEYKSDAKLYFIRLYIRFLKDNGLYHDVVKAYEKFKNNSLNAKYNDVSQKFINRLKKIEPIQFFSIAPSVKGWTWNNVNHEHYIMYDYDEKWINLCRKHNVDAHF